MIQVSKHQVVVIAMLIADVPGPALPDSFVYGVFPSCLVPVNSIEMAMVIFNGAVLLPATRKVKPYPANNRFLL